MRTKIVVTVSGGCVSAIYSNDESMKVEVIDFDCQNEAEEKIVNERFIKEVETLEVIY